MKLKVKSLIAVFSFVMLCNSSFGQTNREALDRSYKKAKAYDYLHHDYKYLDKDYNIINMSSELFDSLAVANKFIIERISAYDDSLAVALSGEFDTWPERNIAHIRITMTWLRVGYILWLSEDEAMALGLAYGFIMPYELYAYFYKQPEKWDKNMTKFAKKLRNKVYEETGDEEVLEMSTKKLFNYALLTNPKRIADYEALQKEKQSETGSVGCGKPNCCQTEGSTKEKCDK